MPRTRPLYFFAYIREVQKYVFSAYEGSLAFFIHHLEKFKICLREGYKLNTKNNKYVKPKK